MNHKKPKSTNRMVMKQKLQKLIWGFFRYVIIIGVSYVILYPIFIKISVSLMSKSDMYDMTVKWIPKNPSLNNFIDVFEKLNYKNYFITTFLISSAATLIQLFSCTLAAYGFARFRFRGRNLLFILVILTLIVPPQTYIVTSYMQFRFFDMFGLFKLFNPNAVISLINTPWPLFILSFGCIAVKNGLFIYILRQFFYKLPMQLEEAAWVDGAGVFSIFYKIMLPNAIPALTTVFVFSFVWTWNDLYTATTYMPGMKLFPIALSNLTFQITQSFGGASSIDTVVLSMLTNAGALLIILPLILFFFIAQKFFVEGIERTGLTGM